MQTPPFPIGLSPRTLVKTIDDKFVPLSSLGVGSELAEGIIMGYVKTDASDIVWYDVDGCLMSGSQPVYWRNACLAKDIGTRVGHVEKYAVQIFLDNPTGWFLVHDRLYVRDYPDSHNPHTLEEIQKVILMTLNKK